MNLAVALLILVIATIVTRNIPGLLEVVILQRLPFTAGGRYAIRTITQYVLAIIGVAVAFDAIGIGWSNVQFLAAAMTVGLGFGLQEIFANFVSGLIILFERPVRVGDVITVGGISGTVTRIRMRATTVVDWDRKELIIPNKEFVTGQIVNWSLSDSVLRITIPVGVSYESDTELARDLLLEVAASNTFVLTDPTPRALFLALVTARSILSCVRSSPVPIIGQAHETVCITRSSRHSENTRSKSPSRSAICTFGLWLRRCRSFRVAMPRELCNHSDSRSTTLLICDDEGGRRAGRRQTSSHRLALGSVRSGSLVESSRSRR